MPQTIRMLFIGNSFTARNNVPGLIAGLADADGKRTSIGYELISAGGASLRQHLNKGEAQKAMKKSKFDYVVLQEQSTLPVKNTERFHENVRDFAPIIKEAGAKPVLYMTWARKNVPETQKTLTDSYNAIGKELGAAVVPAGSAWKNYFKKYPGTVLHDDDGSHPNLAGSYLAACTIYATLLQRDPTGLKDDIKLDEAEKLKLQRIARQTAKVRTR